MGIWTHAAWKTITGWRKDVRGNVALIFGLTVTPLIFFAGAAIDYSGASNLRAKLQLATDAVNLQLCKLPGTPTDSEMRNTATTYLKTYMGAAPFTIATLTSVNDPRRVALKTEANYSTMVVGALNTSLAQVLVNADAKCQAKIAPTLEIALVLDNTGSMLQSGGSQSKIDALKLAARDFVNFIYSPESGLSAGSKIAIVPFAAMVKLDPIAYQGATWIDQTGAASHHWSFASGANVVAQQRGLKNRLQVYSQLKASGFPVWAGCFESSPYPTNVTDGSPTADADKYVPSFAADESGDDATNEHVDPVTGQRIYHYNSYINDSPAPSCTAAQNEAEKTGRVCKYLQPTNVQPLPKGPGWGCGTRAMTRLTNDKTKLLNEISLLVADGATDIHEGAMWGWRAVSPNSVFKDGVAYDKVNNKKILVIMTDGDNQWLDSKLSVRSLYSAYGYFLNPNGSSPNLRLPPANADPTTSDQGRRAIDALTLETCVNARARKGLTEPKAPGLDIYTIGFSVPAFPISTTGLKLLQDCAGDSSRAYVANDSTALIKAFNDIARSIGELRLTN